MKSLHLAFTPAEARRLESIAKRDGAGSLSEMAKRVVMEYVRFSEKQRRGHHPPEAHPSAFKRQAAGQ